MLFWITTRALAFLNPSERDPVLCAYPIYHPVHHVDLHTLPGIVLVVVWIIWQRTPAPLPTGNHSVLGIHDDDPVTLCPIVEPPVFNNVHSSRRSACRAGCNRTEASRVHDVNSATAVPLAAAAAAAGVQRGSRIVVGTFAWDVHECSRVHPRFVFGIETCWPELRLVDSVQVFRVWLHSGL